MNTTGDSDAVDGVERGLSRRDALKRGVVIGGAVVWSAPLVQALTLSAASAETPSPSEPPPSPPPPPGPPPPPPPPRTGKVPSHGIFIVTIAGVRYGLKIDGTTFDKIASPADKGFLAGKGFTWTNPTAAVLSLFAGNGGPTPDGEFGTFVTIPAGATLLAGSAFAFDGGLQSCGNGDKYQAAAVSGGQLTFYAACHE